MVEDQINGTTIPKKKKKDHGETLRLKACVRKCIFFHHDLLIGLLFN